MKKLFSLLLAIVTLLSAISFVACDLGDEPKHTHKFDTEKSRTDPTCQSAGSHVLACQCGTIKTEELSQLEHDYESTVIDPGCTEKGYTEYTCSLCGDSYKDNYVDEKGHSYAETVVDPTENEKGYTAYLCTTCGHSYNGNFVEALGHIYTEVVTEPTCKEGGFTTYTCECGYSYVGNYVSAKSHDYVSVVTPAACTERGYTTHTCSMCEDSYIDSFTAPKGHWYTSKVTDPTEYSKGYTTHTCVCGDSYVDSYVDEIQGMMVYYEDFDNLPNTTSTVGILKSLGWKMLYKNGRTLPANADIDTVKAGASDISTISLSASGGQLIVTNPKNGKDSFLYILSEEYMSVAAEGDYTVQLDMIFKSGTGWASIIPRYQSSTGYNSCYAGWFIKSTGYGDHKALCADGDIRPATGVHTVRFGNTTVASGWWCSRVKGFQDITKNNLSGALQNRKVTVMIQVVNANSTYSHKPTAEELGDTSKMTDKNAIQGYKDTVLGYGFHVWVLDEDGQRVLVSAYNPKSVYNTGKDKWENWLGDALAFGVSGEVSVAIDNLAVWKGLGYMPKDKSTDAYEALLNPTSEENIKADTTESGIVIAKNSEAKLYMVLPENASKNVLYARDKFKHYVEGKMGVTLPSGTQSGNAYELLIGDTGRAESKELKATLTGSKYAIKRDGNKIIVVATNDAFLYDAIEYLINSCFEKGNGCTVNSSKMVFTGSLDRTANGDITTVRYLLTQSNKISSTTSLLANIQTDGICTSNQGGCTDGKYYYQAFIKYGPSVNGSSDQTQNLSKISKVDLSTGQTVGFSPTFPAGELSTNHTNDLTYNPKTNEFIIVHNSPRATLLTVIDADTLEYKRQVTIPCSIYSITYSPERDIYFIGCSSSNNLRALTADFKLLDQNIYIADPDTWNFTTQGIGSDDTFVYCVLYKSTGNVIAIFDWYGDYVGTMSITLKDGNKTLESESIDVDDQGRILVVASKRIWYITPR